MQKKLASSKNSTPTRSTLPASPLSPVTEVEWESLIALARRRFDEGYHPSLKAAARYAATVSGRPVETCYTALRRYTPGKAICTKRSPCDRCAAIRRILSNQS